MTSIRKAHSVAGEARLAAREFYAAVVQPEMALVLFFCSSDYDLEALAEEFRLLFAEVPVLGCTTAGEIGPCGLMERSLVGVSLASEGFTAEIGWLEDLNNFERSQGQELGQQLLQGLGQKFTPLEKTNCFGLMLIDGMSTREEPVARALQEALGDIPLVGGSAGGGVNFGPTYVFAGGSFRQDRAACALIATPLPFEVVKTQHFVPTDQRMVITAADPARRQVSEINGLPAAQAYARLLGVDSSALSPELAAAFPLVVLINGNVYVRSICKANADGSLNFSCAIERGVVLRLARGVDLVENLKSCFDGIQSRIGSPQLTIGFDCVLRHLEIQQHGLEVSVAKILSRNHTIGFYTYGEQLGGIHINQTFTCVAIGEAATGGAA